MEEGNGMDDGNATRLDLPATLPIKPKHNTMLWHFKVGVPWTSRGVVVSIDYR